MPYGLKDIELAKLNEVFAANERIERVILYGSRAKGNYKPFSDVDIALEGAELTHNDLSRLSLAIDDLLLPYQFDISIFHTLKNEALIDHIRRMGITIYEKKSEWKEYKLGEVCTELSDGLHKAPVFKEGGEYIFVNAKNIANGYIVDNDPTKKSTYDEFLKYSSPLNDTTILYSIDGTIGNIAIYRGEKCILGKGACYMNPNPKILNRMYLYYELQSPRFKAYIDQMSTGSTIQHISLKTMRNYVFTCPSLSEQKSIASILSSLDDKIDLLHRENATLEQMAETLFRQWFVVEAKEEWEEGKLGDEFDFTMGQSPNGDSFNEEGIGVPMYQGNADFGFRFPTRRVFTTQPTRFAEVNDTLISVRAPVGAQNMATERCCIGRGVAAFRYKSNPSYYSYTYYKLKSLLEEIRQFNDNGTVFGSISKSDFENLDIMIPDDETIEMFQKQVKVIDDKIINNNNEIQTLIQTRDGLLPKLMSNEIAL